MEVYSFKRCTLLAHVKDTQKESCQCGQLRLISKAPLGGDKPGVSVLSEWRARDKRSRFALVKLD